MAVVVLWGYWQSGKPLDVKAETPVGYLQPDIGQDVKWDPAHAEQTLQTTLDLSSPSGSTVSSSWSGPNRARPSNGMRTRPIRKRVAEAATAIDAPILLGSVLSGTGGYRNGAVLVMPDGREAARYAKTHLVPFGEYIPFREWLSFAGPIVNTIGDFQPGDSLSPLATPAGKVGVTICFEGIFPDLVRGQVRQGAQLLVNMTNDAWYEGTPGPYQHFLLERVRAVETDRYLVRSANRGVCGVVNPEGPARGHRFGGRPGLLLGSGGSARHQDAVDERRERLAHPPPRGAPGGRRPQAELRAEPCCIPSTSEPGACSPSSSGRCWRRASSARGRNGP